MEVLLAAEHRSVGTKVFEFSVDREYNRKSANGLFPVSWKLLWREPFALRAMFNTNFQLLRVAVIVRYQIL